LPNKFLYTDTALRTPPLSNKRDS